MKFLFTILILLSHITIAFSQLPTLTNLPPDVPNYSLEQDPEHLKRPRLTLNGFRSTSSYGARSVRQVIEIVFLSVSTPEQVQLRKEYRRVIAKARESLYEDNGDLRDKDDLSAIYAARAMETLIAYIMQESCEDNSNNGVADCLPYFTDMPGSSTQASYFISLLRLAEFNGISLVEDLCPTLLFCAYSPDPIKSPQSMGATARGYDLYKALESAYYHYNGNLTGLHSQVNAGLTQFELNFYAYKLRQARHSNYGRYAPGNAPIKLIMSAAMAKMALSYNELVADMDLPVEDIRDTYLQEAVSSGYSMHWRWQTGENGHPFWAEGAYYLQYTLWDAIPFWHMLKNNYNVYNKYGIPNPFTSRWFLDPVEWLLDTSTPKGRIMPLDDGNKYSLQAAHLLNWSGLYGDSKIGQKANLISKLSEINGHRASMLTMEVAIPKTETDYHAGLPEYIENSEGQILNDEAEQQLLIRKEVGGNTHYLVLNGEHGRAITKGEGHEQGDQMQLLYQVEGVSFLIDSGYDEGHPVNNSTWNHYYNHNVMFGLPTLDCYDQHAPKCWENEGGIPAPEHYGIGLAKRVNQPNPLTLFMTHPSNNIDVMNASILLTFFNNGSFGSSFYNRRVLFIQDPVNPYLIDLNMINTPFMYGTDDVYGTQYRMRYYIETGGNNWSANSNSFGYKFDYVNNNPSSNNQPPNTLLFKTFAIEEVADIEVSPTSTRERNGEENQRPSQVIEIRQNGIPEAMPHLNKNEHSTVAFIMAKPNDAAGEISGLTNFPTERSGSYNTNGRIKWYSWLNADNTLAVFVARSAVVYRNSSERGWDSKSFTEAGNLGLTLPYNDDFGFARLKPAGNTWIIDSDYNVNLTAFENVARPTNVTIQAVGGSTGPGGPGSGGPGGGAQNPKITWQASTSPDISSYKIYKCTTPRNAGTRDCVWQLRATVGETIRSFTDNFVVIAPFGPQLDYHFRVTAISDNENGVFASPYSNIVSVVGVALESVEDDQLTEEEDDVAINEEATIALPTTFSLERNFPNPFSESTRIVYALPEPSTVKITVYDIMGRVVKVFNEGVMPGGYHQVVWQPEDVGAGMYLYRIEAAGESGAVFTKTHKMVVVK